jgi:hypothetical protein
MDSIYKIFSIAYLCKFVKFPLFPCLQGHD